MICCFTCSTTNVLKPMDSFSSELSSVTEYLNNEKLCQDMCKTVTQNVESTIVNSTWIEAQPFPSLIPNMNSDDDIEEILHEISEILAAQSVENSECTENGLNDNRSVEEILKDAEELVCSGAANIQEENSVSISKKSSGSSKTSKDKVKIVNSVSFAKETKQYTEVSDKLKRSKSFTDFEKTKILDDNIRLVKSDFSVSRPFIKNGNKKMNKGIRKKSETYELKLSDLATVYEDVDVPAETHSSKMQKTAENMSDKGLVNVKEETENVNFLKEKIDSLNSKVDMYEKKEKEKNACEDRLSVAERNRLALLEEEVLSQEELIASYQRENQRLCSDIINAKVIV